MKKILSILLVAFVLAGCSSARIKAPSNEPLFKVKDRTVTESDVFEAIRLSNIGYQIVRSEAQKLLFNELIEEDEAFNKNLDAKLKEAKEIMGKNFELFLKENDYKNEDEYKDAILKDLVKQDMVLRNLITEDYEAIKAKRPREARIVEVDAANVNKALEMAKAEVSLTEIAKEVGSKNSKLVGETMILSDDTPSTELNTNALNVALNAEKTGVIIENVENTEHTKSYIIEIVELDAEKIKDKVIDNLLTNQTVATEYLAKAFVKNNFKIYDQKLADTFRIAFPDFIK